MTGQIFVYIHHIMCHCSLSSLGVVMEAQKEGHDTTNKMFVKACE